MVSAIYHLFSSVAKEIIVILWKRKYLCVDMFEYGFIRVIVQVYKYRAREEGAAGGFSPPPHYF